MNHYTDQSKYLFAVDCVIFGYHNEELCLLLYPRGFEPSKGRWSLMGGFIQESESAENAAQRVLLQTTGLSDISMDQVKTYSKIDREDEARVICITFNALIRVADQNIDCLKEHGAVWWPVNDLPETIFDHREMIDNALTKLQYKSSINIIGKELLPEEFTLIQLRRLYEAINQCKLDPGNFRKKILSLNALERLNKKDYSESKKGAYIYRCIDKEWSNSTTRIVKTTPLP